MLIIAALTFEKNIFSFQINRPETCWQREDEWLREVERWRLDRLLLLGRVETSVGNRRRLSQEGGRRREGGGERTFQSQDDRQVKQPLLHYRGESNRSRSQLSHKLTRKA